MITKIGDIATYINGYAFKPTDWSNEGRPIIRIQDLTGNAYQANRFSGTCPEKYVVRDGDVLISWSASLGIYVWHGEDAVLNQHIFKVVFDKVEIERTFFIHQVEHILEKAAGEAHGATMKHLTKPVFDDLPFVFPPFDEQIRISAELDKVSELIALHERQLTKLDELVKSRFVEMFGEPENNDKRWPVRMLGELCSIGSSKRVYQNEQSAEGIPFWRISDLVSKMDTGIANSELFIPEEKYSELKQTGLVPTAGDILVTSRGTLGRCYIIKEEDRFYFQDGMISWLSKYSGEVTPLYLKYLFMMSGFRKQIDSMQAGSTVSYLSITMLKKLRVMVPKKDMQEQFAAFVAQVDKSKMVVKQSLEKLETFKKSRMQQYFG